MIRAKENKDDKIILQILLINNKDKSHYKTLIAVDNLKEYRERVGEIKERAIKDICRKNNKSLQELINEGYTTIKIQLKKKRG